MKQNRRAKFTDFEPMRQELLQLRAENERLTAENKLAFEERDAHRKWGDELRAENERLTAALQEIAKYNWTTNDGEKCSTKEAEIAKRALKQ
jgi:hypothetical protein